MFDIVQSESFIFGLILLLVYHWGKFSELSEDVVSSSKSRHLSSLSARDFAGPIKFWTGLTIYQLATALIYLLACSVSPPIIQGWITVTFGSQAVSDLSSVPYPLYIALLYTGFTQPTVPVFSKVGQSLKNIVHYFIGIPGLVQDSSEHWTNQILKRCDTKDTLISQIKSMSSTSWIAKVGAYSDTAFYEKVISRAELDDPENLGWMNESSMRELSSLAEQLVYAASIAAVRSNGRGGQRQLSRDLRDLLDPEFPKKNEDGVRAFVIVTGISIIAVSIVRFALPLIGIGLENLYGGPPPYWPTTLNSADDYVFSLMSPILIATILILCSSQRKSIALGTGFWNRISSLCVVYWPTLVSIFLLAITFDYMQVLAFISGIDIPPGVAVGFYLKWFPYITLHAVITTIISIILLYLLWVRSIRRERKDSRGAFVLILFVAVVMSAFYAVARLAFQLRDPSVANLDYVVANLDYVAVLVFLKVVAGSLAFFAILSVPFRIAPHGAPKFDSQSHK